jgi:myo-inositol 2-dehydrogenase / D-chiro-inositol 1-dehydrogenase
VDLAGTRSVLESGDIAASKGLSVVAGTQYRRQPSFYEAIDRIHDGIIGDLLGAQVYYNTGRIWQIPREPHMSDMEWQCRNWYYFTWLSGDHIVEQFVHNIDTVHWVFGGPAEQCVATGGRQQRVGPEFGHIYDHFAVDYDYAGGAKVMAMCRQMVGCTNLVTNRIVGTRGVAHIHPSNSLIVSHTGQELFRAPESGNNPYVQEHTDLVKSIREGAAINETKQVSEATLMAIMGREAAYTGQRITWDELLAADLDLGPTSFEFGPAPFAPVPVPGVTALNRVEWPRAARV